MDNQDEQIVSENPETQTEVAVEEQPQAEESSEETKPMDDKAMQDHIKGVIESILFVHEKPVMLDQLKKVLKTVKPGEIKQAIAELQDHADSYISGMRIVEIAGGYQLLTNKTYASYIRDFYKTRHKEKLSKPSLETMAIIAYKQPVTRADIEIIRGVNCDGVVAHLLGKELIKIVGKKDVPGKPYLYGTTKQFMEYFGLRSLEDLPKLEEFAKLQPDYEKGEGEEGSADELGEDEPQIPKEAVAMNTMEQAKQSAIKDYEANKPEGSELPKQEIPLEEPQSEETNGQEEENKNE